MGPLTGIRVERSRVGFWVRLFSSGGLLSGDAALECSVELAYWVSGLVMVSRTASMLEFERFVFSATLIFAFNALGVYFVLNRPLKRIVLRVPPQNGPQGFGDLSSFKPLYYPSFRLIFYCLFHIVLLGEYPNVSG